MVGPGVQCHLWQSHNDSFQWRPTFEQFTKGAHSDRWAIQAGISQEKAERMLESAGEKKFGAVLEALETRLESQHLPEVQAPIETSPLEARKVDSAELTIKRTQLLEAYREHQRQSANSLFHEGVEVKKQELVTEFEMKVISASPEVVRKSFAQHGTSRPMTKALFLKSLAEAMFGANWENPSDEELLKFSLMH
jgi:hypothetical protein